MEASHAWILRQKEREGASGYSLKQTLLKEPPLQFHLSNSVLKKLSEDERGAGGIS